MTKDMNDRPDQGYAGGVQRAFTPQQISQFLQDCLVQDDESDSGIDAEAVYGPYVSWCYLNRKVPVPDHAFRTALRLARLRPEKTGNNRTFQGLRMTGPAARDYILNSYPQDVPHPGLSFVLDRPREYLPEAGRTRSLPPHSVG